jgi:replicative DNA helicase
MGATLLTNPAKPIASQRAEESVLAAILTNDEKRMEVMASLLEPEHLHFAPYRMIFAEVVERYYSDDTIDALVIAEALASRLSKVWKIEEREVVDRVRAISLSFDDAVSIAGHAEVIKRHAAYRELLQATDRARAMILEETEDPDKIAGQLSHAATRIATGSITRIQSLSHLEAGRRWVEGVRQEMAAREAGYELGAFFGISALDAVVKGLRPGELMILGGAAGVGKTALSTAMVRNFAHRQHATRKRLGPDQKPVAAAVFSMEMSEGQQGTRVAQAVSRIDGEKLRMGTLSHDELNQAGVAWAREKEIPLHWIFTGELRESQLRTLAVDEVRRHNVGLVVVDHFRLVKTDERFSGQNEADEEIVKFLKNDLAKELDVAVICLAHLTKTIERMDKRPRMDDLRGSGMISAFADFVALLYHPWQHATEREQESGSVRREDFELIFDKARMAAKRTEELWMDMAHMKVR